MLSLTRREYLLSSLNLCSSHRNAKYRAILVWNLSLTVFVCCKLTDKFASCLGESLSFFFTAH